MAFELACILCTRLYPLSTVGTDFFITTGVCLACYAEGQQAPETDWCFGKKSLHDCSSVECANCLDHLICEVFCKA